MPRLEFRNMKNVLSPSKWISEFISGLRVRPARFFDLFKKRFDFPVEFVGYNWKTHPELPIAVLFGFNPWKRQITSAYLNQYRTAFVFGNASFRKIKKEFLAKLPPNNEVIFVGWGRKLPWGAKFHIFRGDIFKSVAIQSLTIEDGFLRSMGSGLLHTRPASLSIDKKGIYFDAETPSSLEDLLNQYDFSTNSEILRRAKTGIEIMKAARLTKYYDIRPYDENPKFVKTSRYSILVIGQVEDDASISAGKAKVRTNVDLVMQAKMDFPDADIYFRPHPDYWNGNRKSGSNVRKLKNICAIVPPESSLYELFDVVDHVYTITSLAGFEALVHGLKVTTFGVPFYSNWGLTEDVVKEPRRKRKLTLEELFAGAYLLYPTYFHYKSDEPVTFEETSSYFIVESLKHLNVFDLDKAPGLYRKCRPFKEFLSLPFQTLCYLNETGNFSAADTDFLMKMFQSRLHLADYPQVSFLLSNTSNYDALVQYSNLCIAYLHENIEKLIANTTLLENFLYSLTLAFSNSNGRVIDKLPNINTSLLNLTKNDANFTGIVRNYIKCLSCNLQYDVIDDFLSTAVRAENLSHIQTSFRVHWELEDVINASFEARLSSGHYKLICQTLMQKPTRSERNFAKRHQLTLFAADQHVSRLDAQYGSSIDTFFNKILYWVLLNESAQAAKEFREFIKTFDWQEVDDSGVKITSNIISKRSSDLLAIGSYFLKHGQFDLVEAIMSVFPEDSQNSQFIFLKLGYLSTSGRRGKFFEFYEKLSTEIKGDEKVIGVYARLMREMGLFERSRLSYLELADKSRTVAKRAKVEEEIRKIEFCQESSSILNSVPQPALPKGVIFLASQTCFNTLAMMIPSLVELKKKGYAVVNLIEGMTEHQPTGLDFVDQFFGIVPLRLSFFEFKSEWEIDWPSKKVKARNINFYQGFYESLSVYSRRFHVDINAPLINRAFREKLIRADTCLHVCEKIFSEVVSRGIPASFVSGNSHVTPFSIFRDYARHKNHPLLNFVNCNVAYESYFSNLGSKFANTMCVTDMTLYPTIRAPFMARKDQFERWYEINQNNPEFIDKAKALIHVNRVGSTTNAKELEIIEFLKLQKALGKKIICAFGKVPVDLNVPYDGGPAHTDMADWISHTVDICGKSNEIILLVKPHPHELRPEIALDLVESFHDLISVEVPDNVRLLGHKDINGHALAPYLDLAILYNGSSGLELAAQGIPVMMASHFGKHDYPVDLNYPDSRDHYRDYILAKNYNAPCEEVRKKAAFLICYLGTDEISILNQYSLRQLTNDKIGVPRWRKEKVNSFLENGDPKMKLIADRIVEKFMVASE
jgi:hypothetical protein